MRHFFLLSAVILFWFWSSEAQEKLKSTGKIPILAWYSIPASETSVARYQEMRDAGITYSLSFFNNADDAEKALDAAAKSNIKIVLSCPELNKEPEKTVKRFMNHPALAGYHLRDEPAIQLFPELSDWAKRIQSLIKSIFATSTCSPISLIRRSLAQKTTKSTFRNTFGRFRFSSCHLTTIRP